MTREAEIRTWRGLMAAMALMARNQQAFLIEDTAEEIEASIKAFDEFTRAALSALDGLAGPSLPKEAAQDTAMREKIKDMRRLFRSCAKGFFSADYALGYEEALEHVLGKPAASPSAVDVPREGEPRMTFQVTDEMVEAVAKAISPAAYGPSADLARRFAIDALDYVAPLIEAQARAAAIEEAAKVAEDQPEDEAWERDFVKGRLSAAAAIRALASRPVSEREGS